MIYEMKRVSNEIIDVDTKTNTVRGYASVFGNKDSDNDIIMPGAYTKSLGDKGKRQLHLYQHDSMRPLSSVRAGTLKLSEDAKGLKFESTITPTSWGKDVIMLINDGVLNENRVGFSDVKYADKKGYRELQELKLYEISSVSWGANDQALNMKSLFTDDFLISRIETVTKAFRNGSYTDDTHSQLEIYLLQLNQLLLQTKSTEPAPQEAAKPVIDTEVIQRVKAWNSLFKADTGAAERQEQKRRSNT